MTPMLHFTRSLSAEEVDKYYQVGKMVPRVVHPFLPAHQLLSFGSRLYMLHHAEDRENLEVGSDIERL
jgi:hypothetical protein